MSQSSWNFVCFYMNPKRLGACLEQRNTPTIKCKMRRWSWNTVTRSSHIYSTLLSHSLLFLCLFIYLFIIIIIKGYWVFHVLAFSSLSLSGFHGLQGNVMWGYVGSWFLKHFGTVWNVVLSIDMVRMENLLGRIVNFCVKLLCGYNKLKCWLCSYWTWSWLYLLDWFLELDKNKNSLKLL